MTRQTDSLPQTKSVLSGFISLLRPVNALMACIGVFIGYTLATGGFHFTRDLLYALLAVFFINGAGQAINDYFDYSIDRKQKKTRPLASGLINRRTGLIYSLALFALGTILASFINEPTFWMAVFFSVLLIAYSALMGKIKFAGNIIVSVSVAFTYLFGAAAAAITPLVVLIAIPAFFSNWAREIIKDMEDKDTDKGHKISLPHVLKTHHVNFITLTILTIAILTGYLPLLLGRATMIYAVLVTGANVINILAAREFVNGKPAKAASTLKKAMLVGLVAQLSLLV